LEAPYSSNCKSASNWSIYFYSAAVFSPLFFNFLYLSKSSLRLAALSRLSFATIYAFPAAAPSFLVDESILSEAYLFCLFAFSLASFIC